MPVQAQNRLGQTPGTSVGSHPVDQVWATLHLGSPVDEILDEMRGPRAPHLIDPTGQSGRSGLMNSEEILRLLESRHALIQDSHIVYTSGRHGRAYVNKDAIYPDTQVVSALCRELAAHFAPARPTVVAAPAIGGVILAQWAAHHLSAMTGSNVLAVYAEKNTAGGFDFHRGYDEILRGARVLVVEDILTTGGSVSAVVSAVRACGGQVVGVGALCNRGGVTAAQIGDVPELYSLIEISLESWPPEACPLCAEGVEVNTTVGKGRDFVARR